MELGGQVYSVSRRDPLRVVRLADEWYDDVHEPSEVIAALRSARGISADIFTFWQRLPDVAPKYHYPMECEQWAVLPIKDYEHWWRHQIKSRVRTLIRRSEKEGLEVRETAFDDEFVNGMTAIFNETPVRQGKLFWHYGKDFETVKRQFSRYLFREHMIGAYYRGELVGFVMLANAGPFAITGQVISSIKHRNKSVNNALIAKSVEVCGKTGMSHLVYLHWGDDSLAEFKRRCGFIPLGVPRYWVPLTPLGRVGMALGLQRGWKRALPSRLRSELKRLRSAWCDWRSGSGASPEEVSAEDRDSAQT
jgi:hypothetical protein